jgi:transcriptional regulator with XRE-family HTH domain
MMVLSERGCIAVATTYVRRIREELGETQEDMARRAGLRLNTYRNAEGGRNVSYTTATAVLNAVNALLREKGRDSIELEDLGLRIV